MRIYSGTITAQSSGWKPSFAKRALTFTFRALWAAGSPLLGIENAGTAKPFPAYFGGVATTISDPNNDAAALQ